MNSRTKRDYLRMLESLGLEILDNGITGGNHTWFLCRRDGMVRKVFLASTPSDHRAMANVRTDIRKAFAKENPQRMNAGG